MDFRGRRHERGSNWTDPEIVELLQLWSDESVQIELESSLRNQRVFDRIAHVLREKGIFRTGDQCREKIKKMKLEYRRIKDNHKMRSWKFYDVMDRVLANRPAITYASMGGAVIAQQVFQGPDAYLQGVPVGSFGPASSGFSDVNIAGAAAAAIQIAGRPVSHEQPSKDGSPSPASARQRKRRRGGKTSWSHGGARCGGQGSLDRALASFLNWQRSAEERLLSLEEARLERELQAEERREEREERRAEQERQHELRLFSMLTGALAAVRQAAPTTVTTPTDPRVSPQAHSSASLITTAAPSISSSLSQTPSEAPASQAVSTQETTTLTPPTSVKASKTSPSVSAALTGADSPGRSIYLSNRGNSIRQHEGILQEGFAQYALNKHHDTENPDGVINMGTSENKLCFDLLLKRMTKPDMLHIDPSLLQYSDWRGHTFLREAVADFLTQYCSAPNPLKADNVVVMNGCGSLFSCVAAVICDPKDAILIPTPFYGVITEDVHLYSDVKLFHVPLDCEADGKDSRPFHLTVGKLEEGLIKAEQEGLTIRAVILMNPHNPLADIYTLAEMISFLEFAKRNELHAIVDEVYMLTVFDESATFHSVLSADSLPDPQRTHVMWGLSKDFAMSGVRLGTLHSENRDLVEALAQLGSFHGISGPTQHQVAQLLQDREWIDEEFLPANRSRLKAAHSYVTGELKSLSIPYLDRPATLYIWADLRKYLRESSFEEELSMWRSFLRHKLVLSCGQAFSCSLPGWFRIVFADQHNHLQLGLKRFREALKEMEEKSASPDPRSVKDASEESETSVKEDSGDSDNAATVNSTSSPRQESADQLKEKDSPVPDAASLAPKEFELLDCQASNHAEGLDSLIGTLRHQIRSSDWLEKNTPELSAGEDPEILDVFKALLQRAKK
ncbi:1-aminocyclopropane-1-carboxylate synthase-like protein 1 isoform X3 [Paralichthys olivaceus]|uniref:1-aminocyclopropane-1-carboxylate synthase-like protein 1 isoform X3 n=1 Tax=Paralichthys olivaceus TaxID=8255 RepID=UPI0037532187